MKLHHTKALFAAIVVSLLAIACSIENPEQQIKSAKDYLQKEDNKAAAIQLKNALQKNPGLGEARFLLGTIFLKDGNAVSAEIEFRKALAAKYRETIVIPELARSMLLIGQTEKLVSEFGSLRLNQPAADASLRTTLATAYEVLGKTDSSEAAMTAALTVDPNHGPALLVRARQKAAAKDLDGAFSIIEGILSKDPKYADAWKLKGDILQYSKNLVDDSLVAYRKSIEINPKFLAGHVSVLTILLQQGKLDEATKQLEMLKKVAATNLETKYFETLLAYQKKDYKSARDLSQYLLRAAPNNPRILQIAGAIELQMKSYSQAETYLTRAVKTTPELSLPRRLLVATYVSSAQPAKALAALTGSLDKDGNLDPSMYSLAGEVYLMNGDAKKAEEYFAKALKLQPDDANSRTALAISHLAGGQTATAFDELENIASTDSGTKADLSLVSAYLRRNEFDKALSAVDKLEAKQPDKPVAATLRGRVHVARKDMVAARKSFEGALVIDPTYFAAAASLARLDMIDKKPDDAKKRFENLLVKNPKNGPALLALVQLAVVNGAKMEEIAALLSKAIDANPTDVMPRVLLIELYLRNKDAAQAIAAAQNAVTTVPTSPELLEELGRAQMQAGELSQAIASFLKLTGLQPLSPQPHIRLAEAYAANKNNPSAEQSLYKALEIKPDSVDAQRGLILLSVQTKKFLEATKIARDVQKQQPKSALGWLFEGDILLAQKNWDAAATAYRTGLQRAASPDLAIKLHTVLIASDKATEAEKFATTWLKERPKDVVFYLHLGDMALVRKDYPVAETIYQSLLKAQPDNAVALNNLAWVMGQLKKDGSVTYAEKANALMPNQPDFMDTWAMLLADGSDYPKAIDLLTQALKLQPSNPRLRLNLAKVYVKSGDKGKARTELDELVKLGATSPYQAEASALIKNL